MLRAVVISLRYDANACIPCFVWGSRGCGRGRLDGTRTLGVFALAKAGVPVLSRRPRVTWGAAYVQLAVLRLEDEPAVRQRVEGLYVSCPPRAGVLGDELTQARAMRVAKLRAGGRVVREQIRRHQADPRRAP